MWALPSDTTRQPRSGNDRPTAEETHSSHKYAAIVARTVRNVAVCRNDPGRNRLRRGRGCHALGRWERTRRVPNDRRDVGPGRKGTAYGVIAGVPGCPTKSTWQETRCVKTKSENPLRIAYPRPPRSRQAGAKTNGRRSLSDWETMERLWSCLQWMTNQF